MVDRTSMVIGLLKPGHNASEDEQDEYAVIAGDAGEDLTQKLLDHWKCIYFKIEQSKETKPSWIKEISGKRPDFIVFTDTPNEIIIIDAKFRNIGKGYATLEVKEINEFRQLINKLEGLGKTTYMTFIYPIGGMNADRFFLLTLEDFENGEDTEYDGKPHKFLNKGRSFSRD